MLGRNRGIANALAVTIMIVIIGVSISAVLFTASRTSTTTSVSTSTSTVTPAPVTETATATSTQTLTSTSTSTTTTTAPPTTFTSTSVSTATSTVTGPTTTQTTSAIETVTTTATFTETVTTTVTLSPRQNSSQPSVYQSGTSDCVIQPSCTVLLSASVTPGDVLLVFVPGYSFNAGSQAQSVSDSLGNTFVLYQSANWQRSADYFTDDAFYAMVTHGGPSDTILITYTATTAHSDPIAMDVTGQNLMVYAGSAASCSSSCTASIATAATPVSGSYVAAGAAYGDLGTTVSAGTGFTQVSAAYYYMTGEYSSNVGGTTTTFPFVDATTPATWGDAGIVVT